MRRWIQGPRINESPKAIALQVQYHSTVHRQIDHSFLAQLFDFSHNFILATFYRHWTPPSCPTTWNPTAEPQKDHKSKANVVHQQVCGRCLLACAWRLQRVLSATFDPNPTTVSPSSRNHEWRQWRKWPPGKKKRTWLNVFNMFIILETTQAWFLLQGCL